MQFNLENMKAETNYRIKLSNDSIVECSISYKLVPNTIGGTIFLGDLIQFDLSNFGIIMRMHWLRIYADKVYDEDLEVILRDEKGETYVFYGQRERKTCPLISDMKASRLLCQGCIRYWDYAVDTKEKEGKKKLQIFL